MNLEKELKMLLSIENCVKISFMTCGMHLRSQEKLNLYREFWEKVEIALK